MHFLIIGNPENRRVKLFSETVMDSKSDTFEIVSYLDLVQKKVFLSDKITNKVIVRIESPGENQEVRNALIALGINAVQEEGGTFITENEALNLPTDHGRICHGRQWYKGFDCLLNQIQKNVQKGNSEIRFMNSPFAISTMFDKIECQKILQASGVSIPKNFGQIVDYDQLRSQMMKSKTRQVFIKPAHSSSASGVMAYRVSGDRQEIITSVEMVQEHGQTKLYNSLKIRKYTWKEDITNLINTIAKERILVEEWIPKASINNRIFDLRIVVINGKAGHIVIRTSNYPVTNLHLGNKRGDMNELIALIGLEKINEAKELAEKAVLCFPNTLYAGVDVLISNNLSTLKVLEVNAFGDLLPGVLYQGDTTYGAEIKAIKQIYS